MTLLGTHDVLVSVDGAALGPATLTLHALGDRRIRWHVTLPAPLDRGGRVQLHMHTPAGIVLSGLALAASGAILRGQGMLTTRRPIEASVITRPRDGADLLYRSCPSCGVAWHVATVPASPEGLPTTTAPAEISQAA